MMRSFRKAITIILDVLPVILAAIAILCAIFAALQRTGYDAWMVK